MSRIARPSRSTSSSAPGCGPDAVAIAPVTTIAAQATTPTSATSRSQRGATGAPRPRAWLHASSATTTESATTTSASRKWDITASGMEVEDHRQAAERDLRDRAEERARARRRAHPRREPGDPARGEPRRRAQRGSRTSATTRFPNSTIAWKSCAGNGVEPHRGQLSQPRPDAGQPDERAGRRRRARARRRPPTASWRNRSRRRPARGQPGAAQPHVERDPAPVLDAPDRVERQARRGERRLEHGALSPGA